MKIGDLEHWIAYEALTGCWLWAGCIAYNGYGQCRFEGVTTYVHRLVYELHKGEIKAELDLDHLCRNRACCNPDHLEAVSRHENLRRGNTSTARRENAHCVYGHLFTQINTRIKKDGSRICRRCQSINQRKWYKIRKSKLPKQANSSTISA